MTVTVSEAIEAYLAERSLELADKSVRNHRNLLNQFHSWCENPGDVHTIDEVEPIDISRFRRYRSQDINSNTIYNQLVVLRLFLRFTNRMSWVPESVPEAIVLPKRGGKARDRSIDPDRVTSILDTLERYQYASMSHLVLSTIWTCSLCIGTLRALDVSDVHLNEMWLDIVHRPESDTPLKNTHGGEREINLHGWVADVLRAWINDRQPDKQDEYGREPLLVTRQGRISRASIRRHIYSLTDCGSLERGCDCDAKRSSMCEKSVSPHDIRRSSISAWLDEGHDLQDICQRYGSSPSRMDRECPDSVGTHALRRGAITHYLNSDVPMEIVSNRLNVQKRTLSDVYDYRDQHEKMELRRDHLPIKSPYG